MGVYGGTLGAFAMFQIVKGQLDALYADSQYPVDYATGQLSFSAEALSGYYTHMQEAGTLGVYWQTQFFDFLFIASVILFGIMLSATVLRFADDTRVGRPAAYMIGIAAVGGAVCDAIENLLSFALLAQTPELSNGFAIFYSSFAAIKFGLLTLAMASLVITVAAILIEGGVAFVRELKAECLC
jgi:hypothetical protein